MPLTKKEFDEYAKAALMQAQGVQKTEAARIQPGPATGGAILTSFTKLQGEAVVSDATKQAIVQLKGAMLYGALLTTKTTPDPTFTMDIGRQLQLASALSKLLGPEAPKFLENLSTHPGKIAAELGILDKLSDETNPYLAEYLKADADPKSDPDLVQALKDCYMTTAVCLHAGVDEIVTQPLTDLPELLDQHLTQLKDSGSYAQANEYRSIIQPHIAARDALQRANPALATKLEAEFKAKAPQLRI